MGLENVPFLGGFMQMDAVNRQRDAQQLAQAGQFMTLQGAMEDQAAKRAAIARDVTFRQKMALAKTDEERAQIALEAEGPKGVLTHLDRVSRDRATSETARSRMSLQATQFMETKRLRQAEIDRLTNNDQKREAQLALNNEARAFELQLKAEAARISGAVAADTVMGFQPRPVPSVPTMQSPAAAVAGVAEPTTFSFQTPNGMVQGNAGSVNGALGAIGLREAPQGAVTPIAPPTAPAPTPVDQAPAASVPAPSVQPADAANLDARDLRVRAQPGQGVPGVRAAQTPMPAFAGSPREVRKLQNEWLKDVAEADRKQATKDGKIGVSVQGGRESVFINRVVNSGNQAVADLENVVKLPMSASRGLFGGRSQGKSLIEAGKESLANTMTTQEVQSYNVAATGFQRALAAIEGMGLAPSNALMHQMDGVIFKEGDTNLTKLTKLAQIRQIVEKGLETVTANQRVDAETKKLAQTIVEKARKAVPFTPGEVIELEVLQNTDPNATLKDVMAAQKQSNAWDDAKEKRLQELKLKLGR